MWLDRLSSNSTPSGSPPPPINRSFSPASRRPSHLGQTSAPQRPGFNPRSSSLSLISNDSTTSLLSSSKRNNGSTLKQSITVPTATDPLVVLGKLLGSKKSGQDASESSAVSGFASTFEETDFDLDFGGLNLQQLVLEGTSDDDEKTLYNSQTADECMYNQSIFSTI
jgi:hypothetical protein